MRIIVLALFIIGTDSSFFKSEDSRERNLFEKDAHEDLIKSLPGLKLLPTFSQYSGYLKGSSDNYQLHYWLVEAYDSPEERPLVLWLNGGPGCSSMEGLLEENGPFTVRGEKLLDKNPYSWNRFANVLYLEGPAGVGFSFSKDGNLTTDDDLTSLNNYHALLHFLEKFPTYKNRDFYIFGESYAGVYVPTLAVRVLRERHEGLNLKGIAVGNGLFSYRLNDNSLMYFMNYHGLVDESSWNDALTHCCSKQCATNCMFSDDHSDTCQASIEAISALTMGLDIYNLYAPCAGGVPSMIQSFRSIFPWLREDHHSFRPDLANLFSGNLMKKNGALNKRLELPCVDDSRIRNYLNDPEVRKALHVDLSFLPEWDVCSADVYENYHRVYTDMTKHYLEILDSSIPVMLFAGDVDMACNFLGILWFVDSLGLKLRKPMEHWLFKDADGTHQIGGMYKQMAAKNANLIYATVRGSGHMVPGDKPIPIYELITNFINGKYF